MRTIYESISIYLKADGWPIHEIEGQTAYSMKCQGKNGDWTCVAQADEESRQFVFYSSSPIRAIPERYAETVELLNRINYTTQLGNFEMNYLNGDIRYRTSIEMPGTDLGAFAIERVVYSNVESMDLYLPAISAVIERGLSPLDAIFEVLSR
ncbi:MAG: YbjN domain-containing protein [Synechococcus sp.]